MWTSPRNKMRYSPHRYGSPSLFYQRLSFYLSSFFLFHASFYPSIFSLSLPLPNYSLTLVSPQVSYQPGAGCQRWRPVATEWTARTSAAAEPRAGCAPTSPASETRPTSCPTAAPPADSAPAGRSFDVVPMSGFGNYR